MRQNSGNSKTGRPRAFDERAVLSRAMELFWRNGYARTSIEMLTAELSSHPHRVSDEVTRYRDDVTALFRCALDRAVTNRQLRRSTDTASTASYLFGLLLGFTVYTKCAPGVAALRSFVDHGLSAVA